MPQNDKSLFLMPDANNFKGKNEIEHMNLSKVKNHIESFTTELNKKLLIFSKEIDKENHSIRHYRLYNEVIDEYENWKISVESYLLADQLPALRALDDFFKNIGSELVPDLVSEKIEIINEITRNVVYEINSKQFSKS
jgi:hypothetical protein